MFLKETHKGCLQIHSDSNSVGDPAQFAKLNIMGSDMKNGEKNGRYK